MVLRTEASWEFQLPRGFALCDITKACGDVSSFALADPI